MKGGREDVDRPFWSWDIGFSGVCWLKWPRESLSPQKITFQKETFFVGVPAFRIFQNEGQEYLNAYHKWKYLFSYLAGGQLKH